MPPMEPAVMRPGDYVEILWRRKWSLMLPLVVISMLAAVVALMLPPIYRSEATILIEEQEIPSDFVKSTVTSYAEERIQSINKRIMSFTRLTELIRMFNLYPEMRSRATTEEIIEKLRADTKLKAVSADIMDRRAGRPTKATIAFSLSYQGKDPRKVQQVTDMLTSWFLEENLKERVKQVEEISIFLEDESAKLRTKIVELESKIAAFKEKHISTLPEMIQVNFQSLNNTERNIDSARQQLSSLKERREHIQTQLASVNKHLADEEDLAKKRLKTLKLELITLKKQFSDDYPDVKSVRAHIAELEQKLEQEQPGTAVTKSGPPDNPAYITLSAHLAGIHTDIESTQRWIEELEREADKYRRRIAATPQVENEYNGLIIARNSTRAKYDDLMRKLMEARVAHGMEKEQKGERFTLIEPARVPEKPYKPNRLAIIVIGVVLGIGAGAGIAALREFSDDRIYKAETLARTTSFPVLADIPEIVTAGDKRRRWLKRMAQASGAIGIIYAGLIVFHHYVMDLNVFWAKLMRKFGHYLLL